MKLNKSSFFEMSKLFNRSIVFVSLTLIAASVYLIYACLGPLPNIADVAPPKEVIQTSPPYIDVKELDLGALSLNRNENEIPIPDVHKHILLYSMNDRYDAKSENQCFLIGIKGSSIRKTISPKERVFLGFKDINSGKLRFDDIPSPIWLRLDMKNGDVIMEVGLDIVDEMGEKVVQNRRYFKLTALNRNPQIHEIQDPTLAKFATALECAFCSCPDQLYEIYAPDDEKRGKFRIQLDPQNPKSVIFVNLNSRLFFENESVVENQCLGAIAQVVSLSSDFIGIKVWNASGLEKVSLNLPIYNKAEEVSFNIDEAIKRVRKRTTSSVSCLLGNKNTYLKKGDWAIHTKMGWKVLKKTHDLVEVINHNLVGELFVFDRIEKVGDSSKLVGHLFDKSRSNVKQLYIPFAKSQRKAARENKSEDKLSEPPRDEFDDIDFDDPNMEFDYFDFDF
ncbi:MAG: hypothetical protein P0S95_02670 [Rhabdochlamydiaceae bacterium]|nr:hypothetical protein [Candidatus Amphrikana amoebophyrae]